MNETRSVRMTQEQHDALERLIVKEMHAGNERRAYLLMNLTLQYRFAKPIAPPSNVIPFPERHSVRA